LNFSILKRIYRAGKLPALFYSKIFAIIKISLNKGGGRMEWRRIGKMLYGEVEDRLNEKEMSKLLQGAMRQGNPEVVVIISPRLVGVAIKPTTKILLLKGSLETDEIFVSSLPPLKGS